jgi:hypothetical protein
MLSTKSHQQITLLEENMLFEVTDCKYGVFTHQAASMKFFFLNPFSSRRGKQSFVTNTSTLLRFTVRRIF